MSYFYVLSTSLSTYVHNACCMIYLSGFCPYILNKIALVYLTLGAHVQRGLPYECVCSLVRTRKMATLTGSGLHGLDFGDFRKSTAF